MSRIAKSDVNAALDRIAKNIKDAAGTDGVTSRANLKGALLVMPASTEKSLTDLFFRFIDHRDARPGARVTSADVDRAVAYARQHLLAKYDVNHNGFSRSEINKMSATGQLVVRLAAELKGVKLPDPPAPTSELGRQMTAAAAQADWMSESDSTPAYVEASVPVATPITGDVILGSFQGTLERAFDYDNTGVDLSRYTAEEFPAGAAASFLADQTVPADATDPFYVKNAGEWAKIKAVFDANITGVQVFKVGPKDATGKLATDQGAYELFVVGRTAAGKLAGITFESVET